MTVSLNERAFYAIKMNDEQSFSVRWIHSVEDEEWEEFFRFEDEQIYMDSTRFKTFGAGVPSNAGTDSFIRDGWVYMVDIDRKIGRELVVRSGTSTNHRLIYQNHSHPLPYHSNSYVIHKEKIPYARYIYTRLMEMLR
ncbi:MAG: DUF1850 domain-containing protein [Bacillaceae bacterium]|nr:DUF1850 domain-containing protein [Bacillaceae bacterium]